VVNKKTGFSHMSRTQGGLPVRKDEDLQITMKKTKPMKKTYLLLLALFYLSTASAYGGFVQYGTGYDYPVSQVQIQMSNVQAGNLLVVAIRTGHAATTTVSSPGANWTKNISQTCGAGNDWNLDVWTAPNVPGGNTTITVQQSISNSLRAIAIEYTGVATSNVVHKKSSGSGYSSTSWSAGSVTTTIDKSILFVTAASDSDILTWGAGDGYTMLYNCNLNQETNQKLCMEDRGPVNAGTWSGGFSHSSDTWAAAMIALATSGASPPPPPTHLMVPNAPQILEIK